MKRPNILLIVVDDMGYSDIGCYGGEIPTPNLDGLAANGVRLARFYNAAQCSPTRASLLSGLYPHQTGMGDMNARRERFWEQFGNPAYTGFRKEGLAILPEVLREAGYQCFMSGKWHVGDQPEFWPSERGFERTFSLIWGASEHFSGRPAWKQDGPIAPFIRDGRQLDALPDDFYTTDNFTDEAIRFIDESDPARPWFTYLPYTAPHWPIQAREHDVARHRGRYAAGPEALREQRFGRLKKLGLIPDSATLPPLEAGVTEEAAHAKDGEWETWMETYAAMLDSVDQNVGRILKRLDERGELDNTLIVFFSDNGADTVRGPRWGLVSNAPFRAHMVWVYDGGITSPLIAHWPAGIPEAQRGAMLGGYAHVIDVMPTLLAAAGATRPAMKDGIQLAPMEGMDILPALRGEALLPDSRALFWERQGNEAVRLGDWKLVRAYNEGKPDGAPDGLGARTGQWQLFNMAEDPGETRDRLSEYPALATDLHERYRRWSTRINVIPREIVAGTARPE